MSKVYLANVGYSKTKTYLADLKQVAKLSGQDFAEVLQELKSQINEAATELRPGKTESPKEEPVIPLKTKMAAPIPAQNKWMPLLLHQLTIWLLGLLQLAHILLVLHIQSTYLLLI